MRLGSVTEFALVGGVGGDRGEGAPQELKFIARLGAPRQYSRPAALAGRWGRTLRGRPRLNNAE